MKNNRGLLWNLLNSWWIIPSFLFMACIGFFYIGKKAKTRLWTIMGVVYLVVFAILLIFDDKYDGTKAFTTAISIYYIVGIIHSFYVRSDYLRIMSADEENVPPLSMKTEGAYPKSVMAGTINEPQKPSCKVEQRKNSVILEINSCGEKELASLPGVSIVMAKRAISYREAHNGFSSKEDFFDAIQLKPHLLVQIQDMIACSPRNNQIIPQDNNIGRKLDL